MSGQNQSPAIRLRGVRHNNLKNFDIDLPLRRLIVVTGLSGSGKSSLAFDTLYAEGQRRYIETFSPYARQFFDRMDKPQVDSIEGIPPAIAIEQRNAVRTTRSTVGTMTEICDYMKVVWPYLAQLHCRGCGKPVRKESPQSIWRQLNEERGKENADVLITFSLQLSEKLSLAESLALVAKQGYQRLLLGGEILRIEEATKKLAMGSGLHAITVLQDRLKLDPASRARFVEACEQAYHFGKGMLTAWVVFASSAGRLPRRFSNRLHCAKCDIEYREPSPALFSFNHPLGACPTCKGFGRVITIDYHLAVPDRSLTLAQGAVRPWRTGTGADSQADLARFCKIRRVPMNVPFSELSHAQQRWVIEGDDDYGIDDDHRWPRLWYGVKGYFDWLETKSYKMHVRVLLSRYRAYTKCPACAGTRLKPDALLYLLNERQAAARGSTSERTRVSKESEADKKSQLLTLADFYALPVRNALALIGSLAKSRSTNHNSSSDPLELALNEVKARLAYLEEVGLGYLTLDRPTRTLSGGETERVNLTTCLGTRLVNTLFVLDEPSVGLHPRDTDRLVRILEKLRDTGNTVLVVEHEARVMRAADQIVDLGPGHGATGGSVVFQGAFCEILKSERSLTGEYLSGRKRIESPVRRNIRSAACLPEPAGNGKRNASPTLMVTSATRHNLKSLAVEIPLNRFVCVTGVSGSGKSTLIRDVLYPALEAKLKSQISDLNSDAINEMDRLNDQPAFPSGAATEDENDATIMRPSACGIRGAEHLSQVVMVDQTTLGKTPRSNPAVYIGAFDDIRELFAQSEAARQRGLNASAFSFNSTVGQCERCRGAGFEKIEMQFLSDIFIKCPECGGRRYRPHILEVRVVGALKVGDKSPPSKSRRVEWSIGDILDATVDEAIDFLTTFQESRPAQRAAASVTLLQEVGLGYLRLGQPINTLSGGESQRLKLVRHLADSITSVDDRRSSLRSTDSGHYPPPPQKATLFLFDEPTTGLHFDDVRVLLKVFQRIVDAGNSVVVIEHNLDVIKCADWVIDLGPEAGDEGGRIVAQGTPEHIAACSGSHTGQALRPLLGEEVSEGAARKHRAESVVA